MARDTREKSQIDSFNVSLGATPVRSPSSSPAFSPAPGEPRQSLEKWNILVCSDLGYVSMKPRQVRIAEWNEFMAGQGIVLSGTIGTPSAGEKKPAYVEFPVKSMKDLSLDNIMANAAPFSAYSRTVFSLQQLVDGKTNVADASALIKKAGLPAEDETLVLGLLAPRQRPATPQKKPSAGKQNSSIDNILSMVDGTSSLGDGTSSQGDGPSSKSDTTASPAPLKVTNALFKSVSGPETAEFDAKAVGACVSTFQSKLQHLGNALKRQAFFAARTSSWNCLSIMAKVIGRKKEATLSVVSAPPQDMEENLPQILAACMESGAAPDLVVWDFDVSFTNASTDALARIAAAADRYKCVAVAPLAMEDPLFSGVSGRESIAHLFEEVRMLPFKKLRTDPSSRCLCLCGPGLSSSGGIGMISGNSCWFVAIRWLEMLLGENDPFSVKDPRPPFESVFSQDEPSFSCTIASSVALEAAAMGLTLFDRAPDRASLDKAVTVIASDQAAESYTSMLFNLLVNRSIRNAGIRLLAEDLRQKSRVEAAAALEKFLRAELSACGVISNESRVTAAVLEEDKISIEVESGTTVSGHRVSFSFSF
jgi:hypothetical protein